MTVKKLHKEVIQRDKYDLNADGTNKHLLLDLLPTGSGRGSGEGLSTAAKVVVGIDASCWLYQAGAGGSRQKIATPPPSKYGTYSKRMASEFRKTTKRDESSKLTFNIAIENEKFSCQAFVEIVYIFYNCPTFCHAET
jgi:hypothetical protein